MYAWGYNRQGVIGPQGPDINASVNPVQNSAVKVTGLGRAQMIAAGSAHVCALLTNGEVWCWGSNLEGELGDGEVTTNYNPTPIKVSRLPNGVTDLAVQQSSTCALVGSLGEVYCWGANLVESGNDVSFSVTPTKMAGLGKVSQLSVADHACAIVGSVLYCWGNNRDGECGQSTAMSEITTPTALGFGLLGAPQQVAATGGHTCALLTGGDVYCWGRNTYGCLGDPGTAVDASVSQPVQVAGLSGAKQLAGDAFDNCAVLTSGAVWCWGVRRFGALGDGKIDNDDYSVSPVQVGNVSNAVAISSNQQHSCALLANGSIKCWGQGAVGQLGNSLSSNSGVAVDVTATW